MRLALPSVLTRSSSPALRAGLLAVFGLAAAVLMVERIWLAAAQPLWFDETWTLALARTPDWRTLVQEALIDVNAPLAYGLARLWAAVAGDSNLALRLPGLVALAIAGLLPLVRRPEGLSKDGRLAWAAMAFAWWGVGIFLAGRCYALLFALSMLQCLLFAELLRAPGLKRAFAWCAVGALLILTHYYGIIITAAQGLVYLAARRGAALRTWPAALAFAPAAAWLAVHVGRLADFASPGVAWHSTLTGLDLFVDTAQILSPSAPLAGLGVVLLLAVGSLVSRSRLEAPGPLQLCVLASLLGLALTLLSGVIRPSLTLRYLIPTVPGLLLGLVLLAARNPWPRVACAALAAFYLATALRPAAFLDAVRTPAAYGFETASDVLMRHGVSNVVFTWDHEVARIYPSASLVRVGGVFFQRAGYPAAVSPLIVRPGDDPNRLAFAAATGPRPGVIWIYNRLGATAARTHPPAIPALAPDWRCESVGDAMIGTIACWREAAR